jgi:pyrroloquinoline quinone biosynthesis protein D
MVKLNRSAGEILTRCTGTATVAEIVADLETAFGAANLQGDVESFLDMARQQRWVDAA